MQTTKLYVEYIIIGMETLIWLGLLILLILGTPAIAIFDYCIQNLLTSIFILGACYVLGLLVDRVADQLTKKTKEKIKGDYLIEANTSITVWDKVKQGSFAAVSLSRIRILRSTMLNFAITGFVGMLVAIVVYHNGLLCIITLFGFEIMALIARWAHKSLLESYYSKTQQIEADINNEL